MSVTIERGKVPEAIQGFIAAYEQTEERQIEKKTASIIEIARDTLGFTTETPKVDISFNDNEYQLWLKKTIKDDKIKITFEITPKAPQGSDGDQLYILDDDELYNSDEEEIHDLDEINGYLEATLYLRHELQAQQGRN